MEGVAHMEAPIMVFDHIHQTVAQIAQGDPKLGSIVSPQAPTPGSPA